MGMVLYAFLSDFLLFRWCLFLTGIFLRYRKFTRKCIQKSFLDLPLNLETKSLLWFFDKMHCFELKPLQIFLKGNPRSSLKKCIFYNFTFGTMFSRHSDILYFGEIRSSIFNWWYFENIDPFFFRHLNINIFDKFSKIFHPQCHTLSTPTDAAKPVQRPWACSIFHYIRWHGVTVRTRATPAAISEQVYHRQGITHSDQVPRLAQSVLVWWNREREWAREN